MGSLIKVIGQEKTFTTANTFSNANSTMVAGWNCVIIVNISNTAAVVTVNSTPTANLTILGSSEIIIKKSQNTAIMASNASLLGVLIAFENN